MAEEGGTPQKVKKDVSKLKLDLKYQRSKELVEVKIYVRKRPDGSFEAFTEGEMGSRNKEEFTEETVAFSKTWFDLEQQFQRASSLLGPRDVSTHTKLQLMYCLKACSFVPKEQWATEKDDFGVVRMSSEFADALLGEDGLPLEVVNAIVRAMNASI